MLALLGILSELELPILSFDNEGSVTYDAASDSYSLSATPTLFINPPNPTDILDFTGTVDINIEVDDTGQVNLLAGTTTDLVVTGNIDVDGDTVDDYTGTLLTGQIIGFGFEDVGAGTSDLYDFRFIVTGGALATDFFTGKDIGVEVTSEQSTFTDDFSVDFGGEAKGNLGPVASDQQVGTSSIHGVVWKDKDCDGKIDDYEWLLEGVTVQLLNENGDVIDEMQTNEFGEYWFSDLDAGTYGVMEIQPEEYADGADYVGTIDGNEVGDNSVNDKITGIVLPADTMAIDYNFSEKVKTSHHYKKFSWRDCGSHKRWGKTYDHDWYCWSWGDDWSNDGYCHDSDAWKDCWGSNTGSGGYDHHKDDNSYRDFNSWYRDYCNNDYGSHKSWGGGWGGGWGC